MDNLEAALAELISVTEGPAMGRPWVPADFVSDTTGEAFATVVATILNAVLSGQLIPLEACNAVEALRMERDRFESALSRACLVGGTTYLVERAEKAEAERDRLAADGALAEAIPEPCGGCGEPDPGRRCIGCMHDFFPDRATAEPAQAAQVDLVAKLPRLTEAMIIAACKAHYGSKIVDQLGIDGIDLATEAREYTFRDGFKRMWSGVRAALRANATDASEGER